MRSPSDPLLANVFSAKQRRTELKWVVNNFAHYCHYADDILDIFCDATRELDCVQMQFQRAHEKARFTNEREVNSQLSLLVLYPTKLEDIGTQRKSRGNT